MKYKPDVIFFDVGNTLLFPDWETILAPLAQLRPVPQKHELQALERKTKREFDSAMLDRKLSNIGFWRTFHSFLLADLKLKDEALLNSLTAAMADSANWNRSRPGTRGVLNAIAKSHRTGIISNADGKIEAVLRKCGIADCFLNITDSGIVGYEKPHPAIFEAACRTMNARPETCLYVGDVYCVDYVGATQAGMNAVLFDVAGTYADRELPRVQSLEELRNWLEN